MEFEKKCWGSVRHIFEEDVSVSVLKVEAGFRCSNHYHSDRWNHFRVVSGEIDVVELIQNNNTLEETNRTRLKPTDSLDIPPEVIHRFEVISPGKIVEIYWTTNGRPVSLEDIYRFDMGGPIGT